MKFMKFETTSTVIFILSLATSFFIVTNDAATFGADIESKLNANIELAKAVNTLNEKCNSSSFDLSKSDFSYRKVCAKGHGMQAELRFVQHNVEIMQNEIEGQFWSIVLIITAILSGITLLALKAVEWLLFESKYQAIQVKVPRRDFV
jgi:hypothetical protein